MSRDRITHPAPEPLLPTSGAAEGTALRIQDRRLDLTKHNPDGIAVAAVALAAMREAANGHTPDIRCDRQVRYRLYQLDGSETLPLEDLTAIGQESVFGREVAIAGLTALLACWGYVVVPTNDVPDSGALLAAIAKVAKDGGELVSAATMAESDGVVTTEEAADLERRAQRLAEDAQVTARVAARRAMPAKDRR